MKDKRKLCTMTDCCKNHDLFRVLLMRNQSSACFWRIRSINSVVLSVVRLFNREDLFVGEDN
jgi:hypothetical protein